jgi:NNP family nitrate/nitrite transporter-like MFS transporter
VARRNLIFSIFAEHMGFSIWLLWSVVAVSTLLLLVPIAGLAYCVTNPGTPYWLMLAGAATAALGGGNFASSMTNISFFFPERRKGTALGLNAAGGNLGTSVVQFAVPIVVSAGLVYAGLMWVPLVVAAALCAYLSWTTCRWRERRCAISSRRCDVRTAFGSFIGYSAAFPLVLDTRFPAASAKIAFTGALIGSRSRPVGGWLSDRIGGARVTAAVFVVMGLGSVGVIQAVGAGSFTGFLAAFWVLFAAAGAGNGSTYRMIPAIFRAKAEEAHRAGRVGFAGPDWLTRARREGAAV